MLSVAASLAFPPQSPTPTPPTNPSTQAGVQPFGEALVAIPNTIVALCLNTNGLELVKTSRVMDCLIPIFTNKQ